MNPITKLMYSLHRILGTALCILFLAWFLSAFVMMYHRFPRVSASKSLQRQELLTATEDSLPELSTVLARLPRNEKVRKVTLYRYLGQTLFQVRTDKQTYRLPLNPADSLPPTDGERIRSIAALWCNAPIARIDTMKELDQWIPFGYLKEQMPIYKIHFADAEKTQLYLDSHDGTPLQFSNRHERLWAWLGAIPHWVYFTWLRQDADRWSQVIITLSGIGCLMVIAGMWVTVDVWRRTRRNRQSSFSPYRKRWYHWHYLSGIFFGLFVLTFTFSGLMSLAEIPEWIHKPTLKGNPTRVLQAGAPRPDSYPLDYRLLLERYPQAKQIEWSNFREHPYYTVKEEKQTYSVDAADSVPRPLLLTEEEIRQGVERIYASDSIQCPPLRTARLEQYETYYRNMSAMLQGQPQLPVWKVEVDDPDHSVYYVQPQTGSIRYVNTSTRWRYWTYTALHRMRLPGLNSNATLRKSVLWVLLLGGTTVSLTGVVLSVRYLGRKLRRKKKKSFAR